MPQTRYVVFSIDTFLDVFDPWVEAILCRRPGMSYLVIDTLLDVFDPWVEAILCRRPGMSYLVLTHSSMCLTLKWRLYCNSEQASLHSSLER